jgi:alkylation response protein AidB-like acyl-CoA dehydrogenase
VLGSEPVPPALDDLRRRLRAFIDDELLPVERARGLTDEHQAAPELRRWVRQRSRELGLFTLFQSRELGGDGLGPLGLAVLHEAVGASGSALARLALGDDGGLLRLATEEQRERLLRPILRGERTAAFAFTDAREAPRTIAVRHGEEFLVTGVKSFVTDGPAADFLMTVARVTENAGGPVGSTLFVIPRGAPGVVLRRALRTLDGGVHAQFELHEVAVPPADVLGEIGQGIPQALQRITTVRLRVAAEACGTGVWVLEDALTQVDRPHRSGVPLAEREQVQAMLANCAVDLFSARTALYAAARRAEEGLDAEVEVAAAKVLATEAVARIVDSAIQLTGGAAVVEDHPLERLYRRIRSWRIAEGTTEMLRLVIARGLLTRRRGQRFGERR